MNVTTPVLPHRFAGILAIAVVLTAVHANAAKPGGLAAFKGNYTGTYAAEGNAAGLSRDSGGPTKVRFKVASNGKTGKLTLKGTDIVNAEGGSYSATIQFKRSGVCTTNSIVPGVIAVEGTGTWKVVKGRKIKFTLSATVPLGTVEARGAISIEKKRLEIESTGTGTLGSANGKYNFVGTK
jgi:hypothetical protein